MNSKNDALAYEREDFRKSASTLKKEEVDWLLKRLIAKYPEFKGYETDQDKESSLLDRANLILYGINRDKPVDFKAYVETELKKREYTEQFGKLMREAAALNIGDDKKCDEIEKRLKELLKKADNEVPGYTKASDRAISEIYGDLTAVRSKGKMGSSRMLSKLLGQRIALEMKKKKTD